MPLMMRRPAGGRAMPYRAALAFEKAQAKGFSGGLHDFAGIVQELDSTTATVASAAPVDRPRFGFLAGAYAVLLLGGVGSVWVWNRTGQPVFSPGPEISVFGPLYVFAQAIERLLEPFAGLFGDKKAATVNLYAALKSDNLQTAADQQQKVDQIREDRAVLMWAVACVLGMLGAGGCGALLLKAIGLAGVPPWLDIVVSGLAIGSGTKPLHDLITNLQKTKEQKEDPPERVAV